MYHALYEGKLFDLEDQINKASDRKQETLTLKKRAGKGAYTCPHCGSPMLIRAGEIRGIFFAHSSGDACALNDSYNTYKNQTARESKQHSAMKSIVHEVLKNQEKLHSDLHVEFGYIVKATEKWSYYPDIILKNHKNELAISILTNVDRSRDSKLTKQIKKRNQYYKDKGLQTIWFIEEQQLSLDWDHHVIHLWESEIDLSVKTAEDEHWDKFVSGINNNPTELFDIFGYWQKNSNVTLDTRSLYYIHSTQESIDFSVHRLIIDEMQFPYRAFALSKGYRMSISTALSFNEKLALSDPASEAKDQDTFLQEYNSLKQKWNKKHELRSALQEQVQLPHSELDLLPREESGSSDKHVELAGQQANSSYNPASIQPPKKMSYRELSELLTAKLRMTQKQQMHLWRYYVLQLGFKEFEELWLVAEHLETFEQFEEVLNDYLSG
ncbi:competence protein CoiA [Paenibacillus sp. CFBP13512]|uniref:competence protein CoiA family protein n=1 Tax=Paenibacillus sp. CFBP13512 TaxID=2184007 RepID=UPI0010BF9B72|nr:competence protein CoiA family protein [Paenibacillus sp. CFBP13512]TKJ86067.1 competence protein CoiA [Paenibacillus sp. CFBP13512]